MRFKFRSGWAPSDHNAQPWGAEMEGWPSFPLFRILKVMTGSRAEEKHWVGSEPKWQSHKASKQTQKVDKGLRLVTEGQGSSHRVWALGVRLTLCVKIHSCRDSLLFFPLCFILCAWGCVCTLNIYGMSEGSALYLRNLMRLGEGFSSLHFIHEWVGWGAAGGDGRPISLPVSYS